MNATEALIAVSLVGLVAMTIIWLQDTGDGWRVLGVWAFVCLTLFWAFVDEILTRVGIYG